MLEKSQWKMHKIASTGWEKNGVNYGYKWNITKRPNGTKKELQRLEEGPEAEIHLNSIKRVRKNGKIPRADGMEFDF